ncbi:MAG: pyridoxal-phosphate dependent enzyme [Acidobacteria bacterium]|nr:pyridoxal-phosphate dependent enzyme [Acidobacteriota bacterium]
MTVGETWAPDFAGALDRVRPHLRRTPLLRLRVPTPRGPVPAVAKLECLQITGSFKVRGALNAIAATEAPAVVACSGGNHGLGVAHAALVLGRHATVFLPSDAPRTKVEGLLRLGARVLQGEPTMAGAFQSARAFARHEGLPLIHPYDQAEVLEGQGTLGLELREEAPEASEWAVALGGGGLAAGLALALEGAASVVAIEPETCACYDAAFRAGTPVTIEPSGPARSSLGAPRVGDLPFGILRTRVGWPLLVSDAELLIAQAWLWGEARLLVEPGACAGLAALMSGRWRPTGVAGLILCGGNVDAMPSDERTNT